MPSKSVEDVLKEKKIYQITNEKLVQGTPDMSIGDAVARMQEQKAGYLVIAKAKKVVGIFTETDVARKILEQKINWTNPVSEYMTKDPEVLSPKDSIGKAITLMGTRHFYHLPLVDEKKNLAGVLSVRSLIRFLAEFYPTEVYNLPPDPTQVMETPEGG